MVVMLVPRLMTMRRRKTLMIIRLAKPMEMLMAKAVKGQSLKLISPRPIIKVMILGMRLEKQTMIRIIVGKQIPMILEIWVLELTLDPVRVPSCWNRGIETKESSLVQLESQETFTNSGERLFLFLS